MKSNARRRFLGFSRKDLFELFVCLLLSGLFVLLSSGKAFGQGNVGINNPTPHAKSLLDLTSSDKGLLTPRLTAAQRTAMFSGPDATAKGMLVYQTDGTQGYYYYDGAAWQMLQAGGAGWGLLGNAGTNPATNFIGTTDNQGFAVRTNNTERVTVAPNGKVGIGITTPNWQLDVLDNSTATGQMAIRNLNGAGWSSLNIFNHNLSGHAYFGMHNPTGIGFAGTATASPFALYTTGLPRLHVTAVGDIGIGTQTPSRLLEMASAGQAVQRITSNNAVNGSVVELRNTTAGNNGLGALNFLDGTATLGQVMYHKANGLMVNTASTERMRIDVSGNVGIGTTTPGSRLHVSRGASGLTPHADAVVTMESSNMLYQHFLIPDAAESGLLFGSGTTAVDAGVLYHTGYALNGLDFRTGGNATRMVITGAGNVGVGTTTPGLKFTVANNNTSAGIGVVNQNTSGWSGILAAEATNNGHNVLGFGNSGNAFAGLGFVGTSTAHPFVLLSGNTERIRIATNGNVGIGTSAPTATLEVNGFTKHGTNAPAIKQIEFTGTTAATEGAFVDIAHGLTAGKIMDVRVLIEYTTGNWITTGYTINPEYLADYVIGATNIRLYNHNSSSGSILSKPVKVLVTYKA